MAIRSARTALSHRSERFIGLLFLGITWAPGLQSAGIPFGEGFLAGISFGEARSAGNAFCEGDSAEISFREARQMENQQILPRQTEFRVRSPRQTENQQILPRQTRFRQETSSPNAKAPEA